jgi:hypothetical protein
MIAANCSDRSTGCEATWTANKEPDTWDKAGPWDTHGHYFKTLRKLLPNLDQSLFALIEDA